MSIESEKNKSSIKNLVAAHNELYPKDTLELCDINEIKDVSDLFVCVYDNNQVGLFTKLNFKTKPSKCKHFEYGRYLYSSIHYCAESIYIGYNSNYVGIKRLHKEQYNINGWEKTGYATSWDGKTYLANCDMYNGMSFDDMRLLMYDAGELSTPYEFGKATQEQILQVLLYAKRYYSSKYQKIK